LLGVRERIPHRCRAGACAEVRASAEARLRRWGLARTKGVFQVNAGWEVWAAPAAVIAFGLGALRWLVLHGPAASADVPPRRPAGEDPYGALPPDVPPGTNPPPVYIPRRRRKKESDESSDCCGGSDFCCYCGDPGCGDCGGLDCPGCDCNC